MTDISSFRVRAEELGREILAYRPGSLCWYCHLRPAKTVDHFIPRARGGFAMVREMNLRHIKNPHRIKTDNGKGHENIIPCCWECNQLKGALPINRWVRRLYKMEPGTKTARAPLTASLSELATMRAKPRPTVRIVKPRNARETLREINRDHKRNMTLTDWVRWANKWVGT